MKQPKLANLKPNKSETDAIRKAAARASVKITINIDAESFAQLRRMAEKTGVPYQRLLNNLLRKSLVAERNAESRLDRLEREVQRLKKKLVA